MSLSNKLNSEKILQSNKLNVNSFNPFLCVSELQFPVGEESDKGEELVNKIPVFGSNLGLKFFGSVLNKNGEIVLLPSNEERFYIYNPKSDSGRYVGEYLRRDGGYDLWWGGVMGYDGLIYLSPHNSPYIVVFNPNTYEIEYLDLPENLTSSSPPQYFASGSVVPDGRIYLTPYNSEFIVEINNKRVRSVGNQILGNNKYSGMCYSTRKDTLLLISCSADQFGEYEYKTETFNLVGPVAVSPFKFCGCVYVENEGMIGIPLFEPNVIKFDEVAGTVSTTSTGALNIGWGGGVQAVDGLIYCPPFYSDRWLLIEPQTLTLLPRPVNYLLNGSFYQGAVNGADGQIYATPSRALYIKKIKTNPPFLQLGEVLNVMINKR